MGFRSKAPGRRNAFQELVHEPPSPCVSDRFRGPAGDGSIVRLRPAAADRPGAGRRGDPGRLRERANEAYDRQNRGEIYAPQSQVNTPYSTNYIPGDQNRGLSDLFVHDRMVSDCVRNTGTGTDRDVPPEAPPPSPQR